MMARRIRHSEIAINGANPNQKQVSLLSTVAIQLAGGGSAPRIIETRDGAYRREGGVPANHRGCAFRDAVPPGASRAEGG